MNPQQRQTIPARLLLVGLKPAHGWKMAEHGQRGPLRAPEADRHALPQRARRLSHEARLRRREEPCRRPLRDWRHSARRRRGLLDKARGDRGGDGRARPRRDRRQSRHRRARGADDAGGEARRRPRRAAGRLGTAGRRSRLRREGARGGGEGQGRGAGARRGRRDAGCSGDGDTGRNRRPGSRQEAKANADDGVRAHADAGVGGIGSADRRSRHRSRRLRWPKCRVARREVGTNRGECCARRGRRNGSASVRRFVASSCMASKRDGRTPRAATATV